MHVTVVAFVLEEARNTVGMRNYYNCRQIVHLHARAIGKRSIVWKLRELESKLALFTCIATALSGYHVLNSDNQTTFL